MNAMTLATEYTPAFRLPAGASVYVPQALMGTNLVPETVVVAGPDRYTGRMRFVENVSFAALSAWVDDGVLVQDAFPDMDFADRAFLTSGGVLEHPAFGDDEDDA